MMIAIVFASQSWTAYPLRVQSSAVGAETSAERIGYQPDLGPIIMLRITRPLSFGVDPRHNSAPSHTGRHRRARAPPARSVVGAVDAGAHSGHGATPKYDGPLGSATYPCVPGWPRRRGGEPALFQYRQNTRSRLHVEARSQILRGSRIRRRRTGPGTSTEHLLRGQVAHSDLVVWRQKLYTPGAIADVEQAPQFIDTDITIKFVNTGTVAARS